MKRLIGSHVTIIVPQTNLDYAEGNIANVFSGWLEEVDSNQVVLKLLDGTTGIFNKKYIVGMVENEVLQPDDPRLEKTSEEENPS